MTTGPPRDYARLAAERNFHHLDETMEILTGEQMRNVDRRAIEEMGIPGLELMESAGRGVAEALLADYPDAAERGVVIVCGKGNNGGDGLVAGRHLSSLGVRPTLLLLGRAGRLSGDAETNLEAARKAGLSVIEVPDAASWTAASGAITAGSLVLDAILGTGVQGGARGLPAVAIGTINESGASTVSVDLPSGLNADTTRIDGVAVRAERTYTLCRPKLPLVTGPAAALAGRVTVVPIGIPDEAVRAEKSRIEWIDAASLAGLLPRRPADSHKGTYGHLFALAGSAGKSGAAVLLGRGALRSGVGLVTVGTPESVRRAVGVQQAEVMVEGLPETGDGVLGRRALERALALLGERDALAIGPGLGTSPGTRALVLSVLRRGVRPTVVDADGLNAVAHGGARALERLRDSGQPMVLTPHPGEAGRMLGSSSAAVQRDRPAAARKLARSTGAVVALKGQGTVVASPSGRIAVNSTGNPGMATAGTGDVLTGMIGAFLARAMKPWDAARLAVFAHGAAGDRAARIRGQEGLIASDLLEELPSTLAELG